MKSTEHHEILTATEFLGKHIYPEERCNLVKHVHHIKSTNLPSLTKLRSLAIKEPRKATCLLASLKTTYNYAILIKHNKWFNDFI